MVNQTKYKCIIVDDEALARQLIEQHISGVSQMELTASFALAQDVYDYLKTNHVDVIFLDIQMPGLNGIDFLKSLINPPKIIFTTAFSEFALEGYELNVVDYLLKPITFERFEKATQKIIEILNIENTSNGNQFETLSDQNIIIKSSHQLVKINLNDILYIEGMHKYIKIVTTNKKHTTLFGLTAMEKELDNFPFFRCHRSFIINYTKIDLIDGNTAIIDGHKIPISKSNKADLILKMGKKIG